MEYTRNVADYFKSRTREFMIEMASYGIRIRGSENKDDGSVVYYLELAERYEITDNSGNLYTCTPESIVESAKKIIEKYLNDICGTDTGVNVVVDYMVTSGLIVNDMMREEFRLEMEKLLS